MHTQAIKLFLIASLLLAQSSAMAAFSLTTERVSMIGGYETRYKIDTDAGLTFSVRSSATGQVVSRFVDGDITNLIYKGIDYQSPAAGSHVGSGATGLYSGSGAVTVRAEVLKESGQIIPASSQIGVPVTGGDYIKVTVSTFSAAGKPFVHYYIARRGVPYVYMGTYFEEEPDVQQYVRFVARIPRRLLPYGPDNEAGAAGGKVGGRTPQDVSATDLTIEAGDIFTYSTGPFKGETRSKHYSNRRQMDWQYLGGRNGSVASTSTVGIWIYAGNTEGSSGGPFYRNLVQSIGYQPTGDNNELTYVVNYAMAQTEPYRLGVLNVYTLIFNNGAAPSTPPVTSWLEKLGLLGMVNAQARGGIAGLGVLGRRTGYNYTVGFANERAQYWAPVDSTTGRFSRGQMIPGAYTLSIYKNELPVYISPEPIKVDQGVATTLHTITIDRDPESVNPIWRIGKWDGTPRELLNGGYVTSMHPSDARLRPWMQGQPFLIGSSRADLHFPAYQWKGVNGQVSITFDLTAKPERSLKLRIGTTTEFKAAVPQVSANQGAWVSTVPSDRPPNGSRNLTVGTYRGVNRIHTFDIPAEVFRAGRNQIDLFVASGISGDGFLSPGVSFDALDLVDFRESGSGTPLRIPYQTP